ncbi:MAG: tetratricopeptide repeat protein [Pseudomonadota bacterium]
MKKIGLGARPSEIKGRNKSIDFGEPGRDEASEKRYRPQKPAPRGAGNATGTWMKIIMICLASMVAGVLLGSFLLFDFSLSLAIESMHFITGGKEIEIKNNASFTVKFSDGLKFQQVICKGFYNLFPPSDLRVEIAGIQESEQRYREDIIPLLKPEERTSYDIMMLRGNQPLGKISFTLDMDSRDWISRADAVEDKKIQAECYKKANILNPDSDESHIALGRLYESEKNTKLAIAEYESAVRIKPQNISAVKSLLALYKKAGSSDKALETYEKLAKVDPGASDDYYYQAGLIAEKQGSDDKAMALYQDVLEKNRGHIDARQRIIKLCEKNKQWNKAIENTNVLLEYDAKNGGLYLYLSDMYLKKNDVNAAIAAVEKAQKLRPNDSSVYLQLAVLSEKAKDDDKAVEYYKKALKINTKNAAAYNNLGLLLEKKGNKKESIDSYEKAISLEPKNAGFYKNLADAYEKNKDWDKAAKTYERVLGLDKGNSDAMEAVAVLYYKANNKEKSLDAYRDLAKAEPKKVIWHQKMAYLYEDFSKIDAALDEYKTILELEPSNAEAKQKRVELAKKRIKKKNQ